ncbi:MAG: response regulator transcription factor [Gemmatimonas sp.]
MLKPVSIARPILVFGLVGGALTLLLRTVEYRYLVLEHSMQMYGGLIAVIFIGFGIWLGLTLVRKPETIVVKEFSAAAPATFERNADGVLQSGLTPRELEILEHIARGLSNREIAEQVNLSENTVKTHSKRVFEKLNAKRRTQAVQAGKELGILP